MRAGWQDPYAGGGLQFALPSPGPVVKRLIAANLAIFLGSFLLFLFSENLSYGLQRVFGITPALWVGWFPFLPVWQLVSWGFLHSPTDVFHILGNMLFLYFLGTLLEGIVGPRPFLANYVVALLVSGAATLLVGFLGPGERPTIGASGAVLAIVVATAVLRPNTRVIFFLFPITLKTLALFYVGFDVFYGLLSLKGAETGVAHLAHLTGAGYGFWAARSGFVWRDPWRNVEAWRAERQEAKRENDEERLDMLLDKISREGIHSLSPSERAFLKRASKRR